MDDSEMEQEQAEPDSVGDSEPEIAEAFQSADFDAERQVIGAAFVSPQAASLAVGQLRPEYFFYKPFQHAMAAVKALIDSGQPVSSKTVVTWLGETKGASGLSRLEEAGGAALISGASDGVDPSQCGFWAERVRRKFDERGLVAIGEFVRREIKRPGARAEKIRADLEDMLQSVEIEGATKRVIESREAKAELGGLIERYITDPDGIHGLATGWPSLDRAFDGFKPGNVTITYAPSSRYKSWFTTNIGWLFAKKGIPGLWYTTEMPRIQVQERLLQLEAKQNLKWLRRDGKIARMRPELMAAVDRVAQLPIYFCESDEVDVANIRTDILRHVRTHGIQYAIIDLIDFVSVGGNDDESTSEQTKVMRRMKKIAKAANIHIFLVTHITKQEKSFRSKPSLDLEEMKGSGSKGQDVDNAISLMPVWKSDEGFWIGMDRNDLKDAQKARKPITIMAAITKSRHGELDDIPFVINFQDGGRMMPLAATMAYRQAIMEQTNSTP